MTHSRNFYRSKVKKWLHLYCIRFFPIDVCCHGDWLPISEKSIAGSCGLGALGLRKLVIALNYVTDAKQEKQGKQNAKKNFNEWQNNQIL